MSDESMPISEAIAELETYRQRIFDDALDMARKLKLSKKATLAQLEKNPEVIEINRRIAVLQERQDAATQA
ncbi:MAG: acetyltransferase [Spirulina sp. SIO3F2]|nr:acetyltransferase [Spirulina sp. SIO3F2]